MDTEITEVKTSKTVTPAPAEPTLVERIQETRVRLYEARIKLFDDQMILNSRRDALDEKKAEAISSKLYAESGTNETQRKVWLGDYVYPYQVAVDEAENITALSTLELSHVTDDWAELKMLVSLTGCQE